MTASSFELERVRLGARRDLSAVDYEEFQRLAKGLLYGPEFQLLFVDCSSEPKRDRLIEALDGALAPAGLVSNVLRPADFGIDAADLEQRLQAAAHSAQVVHLLGAARWFDSSRWDDLNQRRERLARAAAVRLVFWLDATSIRQAAKEAQDLWAWRGGVYAFESASASASSVGAAPSARLVQEVDARSMAERHRRVVALREALASVSSSDLRVPLVDELGRLLFALGEYDEALLHWRDVELPLHAERGDDRAIAITMGQIADVLQSRGELDEALRIRREEQLPVYERLGDARSCAVTMGKIADVLQSRGELDEALRIRREEELPVYERLGDRRSLMIGRAKLADLLLARGTSAERVEARRRLREALVDAEAMVLPEAARIREWLVRAESD